MVSFLPVSVTLWLHLHLSFTRKCQRRFGKLMFSKPAFKVDRFENTAILQPYEQVEMEDDSFQTRRWRSLIIVKKEARLVP